MRLRAEGIGCVRGGRVLFRALSFVLTAGGALVVTGANGAGKTSLLRIVAGLLRPAEGHIAVDGGGSLSDSCHFISHLDAVKGALSVSENLAFIRALLGGESSVDGTALARLGLTALGDLPGYVLSAGQRRRLALSRLLAAPRPIWLLDEPTASLDIEGQEVLLGMIGEHRARGGIVIAATHMALDLEGAREISLTRIAG
jgi:heme exporter protein A